MESLAQDLFVNFQNLKQIDLTNNPFTKLTLAPFEPLRTHNSLMTIMIPV